MLRAKYIIATRCELSANPQKLDFMYLMPFLVYKLHVSTTHPPAHQAEPNSLRILSAANATWDQTAHTRTVDYEDWHFNRKLQTASLQYFSFLSCLLTKKTSIQVTGIQGEMNPSSLYQKYSRYTVCLFLFLIRKINFHIFAPLCILTKVA